MINNLSSILAVVTLITIPTCGANSGIPKGAYQGVVELDEVDLAFELGGRVNDVPVEEGDAVEPNAVLARLDDTLERTSRDARAEEATAAHSQADLVSAGARSEDVRAARAQIRAQKAVEKTLMANLTRERSLAARGASTQSVVDNLNGDLDRARAQRQSLEANLSALEHGARPEERTRASAQADAASAAVALSDARIERHVLRSPLVGRVLDLNVKKGEFVAPGVPVATVGDVAHPFVEVFVPQGELHGIRVGAPAKIKVDAERTQLTGRVEHIDRRTEFTPRYLFSERERPSLVIRVRVRIDDPEERLHAGVPAFVTIDRNAKTS